MQTFGFAPLSRENYTPLTWVAVVYTKECGLSCMLIAFHTCGNIDGSRKIILADSQGHFVPADKVSNLFSQRSGMKLYTGRKTKFILFKINYNYEIMLALFRITTLVSHAIVFFSMMFSF